MKLYYLMGKSASGKDTIFNKIINDERIKNRNISSLVIHTTRPKREGDIEGKTYFFNSEDQFYNYKESGAVLEYRKYNVIDGVWIYFTLYSDFKKDNEYIGIGTPESLEKLRQNKELEIVPIYIYVEDGQLLQRALDREKLQKEPKYSELCRRFLADREDFSIKNLEKAKISLKVENSELDEAVQKIIEYILGGENEK